MVPATRGICPLPVPGSNSMATLSWADGSSALGWCPSGRATAFSIRLCAPERRSCRSPRLPCAPLTLPPSSPTPPPIVLDSSSVVISCLYIDCGTSVSPTSPSILRDAALPAIDLVWLVVFLMLEGWASVPAKLTRIFSFYFRVAPLMPSLTLLSSSCNGATNPTPLVLLTTLSPGENGAISGEVSTIPPGSLLGAIL